MLLTSKGFINKHFLQFAATSFYYSTGYPVSFCHPTGQMEPYLPLEGIPQPYENYLSRQLESVSKKYEMNTVQVHYMDYNDLILFYPISYKNSYLGCVIAGPMIVNVPDAKIEMTQPMQENAFDINNALTDFIEKK